MKSAHTEAAEIMTENETENVIGTEIEIEIETETGGLLCEI